ncbi:MAG: hypothetical protein C5B47_04910 [Verrucomicrobia bacterium]|nr:MAG: hypothetical protein C5B47_04910 [Verrucomicrobiota bacterium]
MKLSKESRILCRELFRLCLDAGKVQAERVHTVVDALLSERPKNYFQILRALTRMIRLNFAERQAEVQSAVPLSINETSLIEQELKSLHGSDLEVRFRVNPDLLGGLRIRIGSEVWDGTISDRLRRLLVAQPQQPTPPSFPCIKTLPSENSKISQLVI